MKIKGLANGLHRNDDGISVVGFVCFPLMFSELEKDLGAKPQLSNSLSLFFIFSTIASIF